MKALYRRSRGFVRGGGFTLIELLVGLTLLGLVAVAFYGIHNETQRTLYRSEDRADMQQNARAAMQVVVEELRNATRLMTTSDSQVLFLSDQYVPGQERTIRLDTTDYDDDGNQSELLISRSPNDDGSPGPGIEEIAAGIYDLNFRYFGQGTSSEDEDEVTSPIAVQRIEIQLAAETSEEGGDERRTVTLTSQVRPRNLGLPPPPAADSLPPTAPTGLSATASCGTLVVKWKRNPESDIVGYRLYYDTDGGAPYIGTGATQGDSPVYVGPDTTYTLTGLNTSSTYTLAVRARDALVLESAFSASVNAVPSDGSAPAAPTSVQARIIGESTVRVAWTAPADADIAYYRVHYDRDASGTPYAYTDSISGATYVEIDDLMTGSLYYFTVSAVDYCGNRSPGSTEVSIRPMSCDEDADPPANPTGFAGTSGDAVAKLSWNPSPELDLAGYRIDYSGPGGTHQLDLGLVSAYNIAGLTNDATYRFTITGLDVCGNLSGPSGEIYVTPQACAGDDTSPAAPRNLAIVEEESPMGDQLHISWSANLEADLGGYLVYVESGGAWADTLNVGNEVFATVGGLIEGQVYHIALVSYDRCDNLSTPSAEVVGTPRSLCTCFPSTHVTAPVDHEEVADLIILSASAAPCSTGSLAEVIFYFDEQEAGHFYSPPYWTWFDTHSKTDGWYNFRVLAVDTHGCTDADTVALRVDNSGGAAPCVNVDPGIAYALTGDYHQEINYALIGTNPDAPFSMGHALFYWDEPDARLHRIESPLGVTVWDSGPDVDHAATSGTLFPLMPVPDVTHDRPTPMKLYFWDEEGGSGQEDMNMSEAMLVATFFSSAGQPCGPDTISTACRVVVTSISATSGNNYQAALVDEGDRYYTDRFDPRVTDIPDGSGSDGFEHLVWVRTWDGDNQAADGFELNFNVDRDATIYVGYDERYVVPSWLSTYYTDTGSSISVTDSPESFRLYKTNVPAGPVRLYGNYGVGFGSEATRNYIVLLRCQE